jgi:3-isopropylmalate/(R)-2-methylmalate dehydratase large subunit
MSGATLFDKVWNAHVVEHMDDGWALLHIDRHMLHDLSGPPALLDIKRRGLSVHRPKLTFAMADHLVSSAPDRTAATGELGGAMWEVLKKESESSGIDVFGIGDSGQGIVHVSGPELGIVLPGLTVICGDSHTCTNGALGALAFGVGSSQSAQALAAQALLQHHPHQMRIRIEGPLSGLVSAKDVALFLIASLGASAGTGFAVEYAGPAVEAMGMEERLTLCNLTVELGAKFGMIAPDGTTIEWIAGRPYAPSGSLWESAVTSWSTLATDADAMFDREERVDGSRLAPMVTWGTSPEHAVSIEGNVPDPADARDPQESQAWRTALDYMGLRPGGSVAGTPVDWVFIGSCANSRLSDLRAAADLVRGRHVAPAVTAWVVPGSEGVRREAEAEGLDRDFEQAGFVWRRPGCSLCVAANGERVPPGARCVSTSNRNFVGRQGPGARTHLASPATAAASAIAGHLVDPRAA